MAVLESLNLINLKAGNQIRVRAGEDSEALIYEFKVLKPGQSPLCELTQTSPDGETIEPQNVILEGTGVWTTPEQNPIQNGDIVFGRPRQELAMTIGWGVLRIGSFLVIADPEKVPPDRAQLMPACSEINLV